MYDNLAAMMKRHPCNTTKECTDALREIIQEIALLGLWRGKFFEHAAFYGGTALRILHGISRFSEDLDFSLLHPNPEFSLNPYNSMIQKELASFGFTVNIETKLKNAETQIESAFIKTSTTIELLRIGMNELSFHGLHPASSLKIKLEVDTNPPPEFQTEFVLLKEPAPIFIRTYSLPDLFAGKMHALLCRNWKGRVKGRDWYDFVWLAIKGVPVNLRHLEARLNESKLIQLDGTLTEAKLQELLAARIDWLDVEKAKEDMGPFIFDKVLLSTWSKDFFRQIALTLKTV